MIIFQLQLNPSHPQSDQNLEGRLFETYNRKLLSRLDLFLYIASRLFTFQKLIVHKLLEGMIRMQ